MSLRGVRVVPGRCLTVVCVMASCLIPGGACGDEVTVPMKTPGLLWYDAVLIDEVRERVAAGDAALEPAVQRLREDAAAALEQEPLTVTAKQFVPPGGTRHDYRSLGTYWWPDPNRADGLPYIRRDGKVNPEVHDPRYADRVTLRKLESSVGTLGWAYLFFGDERYAEHAATMLRVFFIDEATRMNPHLRYAQAIPGHNDGRFIGLIDTARLACVLDAATILRASPAWGEEDHAALREWFADFLDWLTTHEFGRLESAHHNNHGTWYDVQVASYAKHLGREELLRDTLERARSRIDKHFKNNGQQPHELERTRSFDYSVMNLWAFMLLARMGEDVGVDLWHHGDARLRAGLGYLLTHAMDRDWSHEQITPIDQAKLLPLVLEAARVYGEPGYERHIQRLAAEEPAARTHLLSPAARSTDRARTD